MPSVSEHRETMPSISRGEARQPCGSAGVATRSDQIARHGESSHRGPLSPVAAESGQEAPGSRVSPSCSPLAPPRRTDRQHCCKGGERRRAQRTPRRSGRPPRRRRGDCSEDGRSVRPSTCSRAKASTAVRGRPTAPATRRPGRSSGTSARWRGPTRLHRRQPSCCQRPLEEGRTARTAPAPRRRGSHRYGLSTTVEHLDGERLGRRRPAPVSGTRPRRAGRCALMGVNLLLARKASALTIQRRMSAGRTHPQLERWHLEDGVVPQKGHESVDVVALRRHRRMRPRPPRSSVDGSLGVRSGCASPTAASGPPQSAVHRGRARLE